MLTQSLVRSQRRAFVPEPRRCLCRRWQWRQRLLAGWNQTDWIQAQCYFRNPVCLDCQCLKAQDRRTHPQLAWAGWVLPQAMPGVFAGASGLASGRPFRPGLGWMMSDPSPNKLAIIKTHRT